MASLRAPRFLLLWGVAIQALEHGIKLFAFILNLDTHPSFFSGLPRRKKQLLAMTPKNCQNRCLNSTTCG
jgi:hypothetical protein